MSNSTKAKKLALAAAEFRSYDDEGNECWEVETILDRKYSRSTKDFLYLVKWKGWRIEDSTWEPVENLLGSLPMLEEFEKNFQELVLPLEPAYVIIGPESKPMTLEDLKKSKSSSGLGKASPLPKIKKEPPPSSDEKPKKQVEKKQKKGKKTSKRTNNGQDAKKMPETDLNETNEALMTDSSSHKSERTREAVMNESLSIEVKTEVFDRRQSQARKEQIENSEIRIHSLQFGHETICKQEPSEHEGRAVIPIAIMQENAGLKEIETINNILGESPMKEKRLDNESHSNEGQGHLLNSAGKSTVGSVTASMTEEANCPMEVEPSLANAVQSHNTNLENSERSVKESSHILVGGLVANFSSSKSLTMPDQVCFGRSELPHFEQPKPKIVKNNGLGVGCGFFTEKTKGLSRKQTESDSNQNFGDSEFIDFYSPPSKFQGSNYNGSGIRLSGKLVEPNRVRYKQQHTKVPDVGFDWKDIMQWANSNRIVVGAVSEMKNKIRKAMEAEERKARRQNGENASERSESRKRSTKRSKIRSRGTRTEEKNGGKKGSGKDRELSRDKERDKRENSVVSNQEKGVRRASRRFRKDDENGSELQLDEILSAARRRKKKMRGNGETQSLNLDPEDDDFDGIKIRLELNFGYDDEQRVFGSEGDLEDSSENDSDSGSESSGWGLGTTIFVESNIETEI